MTMSPQQKERPILFSAPMVRAILEGRKTVTRRVVKGDQIPRLCKGGGEWPWVAVGQHGRRYGFVVLASTEDECAAQLGAFGACPYGRRGDRLWVRETFYAFGRWITRYSQKKGRDEWHFLDMTLECQPAYLYDADTPNVQLATERGGALPGWYKRPAIFMPRNACRIVPEITDVRVERLQDISDEQAQAEGIITHVRGGWHWHPHNPSDVDDWHQFGFKTPVWAFHDLWVGINGQENWDANPWVWVVEFKRVQP